MQDLFFVASNKILGWITCATFTLPKKGRYFLGNPSYFILPGNPRYFIQKNSNDCEIFYNPLYSFGARVYYPLYPFGARVYHPLYPFGAPTMVHIKNVMWFFYLTLSVIKMRIKCRDEVKISLKTFEPFQVIEWRIALIYKDEEEEEEGEEEEEDDEMEEDVDEEYDEGMMKNWRRMEWRWAREKKVREKRRRKDMDEDEEDQGKVKLRPLSETKKIIINE